MAKEKQPRSGKKGKLHDAVFKAFFSDTKIAQNYLLHYSPPAVHRHIDFSFFRKIDSAFVSGRFGISFSDVLYETRLTTGAPARLIFLFEHKSYIPGLPVHLQLLDYMLQIWEDDIKNDRPLSVIVPVVIYHGKAGWEQQPFSDFWGGLPENWQVFIPNFHYLLTDLSQMPAALIEEKKESEYLVNLLLALKFSRNRQWIKQNQRKIITFEEPFYPNVRAGILLQVLTVYLFKVTNMTSVEYNELKQGLPKVPQQVIDFIHEVFGDEVPRFIREEWEEEARKKGMKEGWEVGMEKGMEQGMQEGMEKGMQEGMEKGMEIRTEAFALKIIKKFPGWNDAKVAEFVGVTEEYVQRLRQESAA